MGIPLADIRAGGSLKPAGGAVQITADTLLLNARGPVGSRNAPMGLNVNQLEARARAAWLLSAAPLLTVRGLSAGTLALRVLGSITGRGISAGSLSIHAFGSIGSREDPLRVRVSGRLILRSLKGTIHCINSYGDYDRYLDWMKQPLQAEYDFLVVLILPVPLLSGDVPETVYLAAVLSLTPEGARLLSLLPAWSQEEALSLALSDLKTRGVVRIGRVLVENAEAAGAALARFYPEAVPVRSPIPAVLRALAGLEAGDVLLFLRELNGILGLREARWPAALARFDARWSERFPALGSQPGTDLALPGAEAPDALLLREALLPLWARLLTRLTQTAEFETPESLLGTVFRILVTEAEEQARAA